MRWFSIILEDVLHGEKLRVQLDQNLSGHSWRFDNSNNILSIPRPNLPVDSEKYVAQFVPMVQMQYTEPRQFVGILLHLHQPPGQEDYWIDKITDECYLPLSHFLANTDLSFRGTVNATSSFLRHLERRGKYKVIDNLRKARDKRVIELTATGNTHPILPRLLMYEDGGLAEVSRQLISSKAAIKEYLGDEPRGVFPPEMAFSRDLALVLDDLGFEWAVTDAPLYDSVYHRNPSIPHNFIGSIGNLSVFFRSSHWSNELTVDMPQPKRRDFDVVGYTRRLKEGLNHWFIGRSGYIVLAFDGEALGHQVPEYTDALETIVKTGTYQDPTYKNRHLELNLIFVSLSRLLNIFGSKYIDIRPGSWSTSEQHIEEGEHFPAWYHSRNQIQGVLDRMMGLAIGVYGYAASHVNTNPEARKALADSRAALDDGEQSDSLYWARRLEDRFSTRHIYTGFNYLSRAINKALESLERSGYNGKIIRANGFNVTIQEARVKMQELTDTLGYFVDAAQRAA